MSSALMTCEPNKLIATAVMATMVILAAPVQNLAQGLNSQETIDSIVGSEVKEEEKVVRADETEIIEAIEKTAEQTKMVRTTSSLDKVNIVFLADAAEKTLPSAIAEKAEEHKKEISALRDELQGNAMLYHAINSRSILLRDVLAVRFDDKQGVVIYAMAKPAE